MFKQRDSDVNEDLNEKSKTSRRIEVHVNMLQLLPFVCSFLQSQHLTRIQFWLNNEVFYKFFAHDSMCGETQGIFTS